jgi:hypothetical protein
MTRFAKVLAAVLAAGAVSVVAPTAAQAAEYGCAGNLIDTYAVKSGSTTLSTIRLYYNSSNGYNCAVNVKQAQYQSTKSEVSITMFNEDFREDDNNRPGYNNDSNGGNFYEYAGPVKVYGKGKCVVIWARTKAGGKSGNRDTGSVHC